MLRLKDLELVFFANDTIEASCLVKSLLSRHVFNLNPWETKVDHHRVISLELEAPSQSNIRRDVGPLVRGPVMMKLALVLHDDLLLAFGILFSFIERGILVQGARARPGERQFFMLRLRMLS